jgi:hypothetical protein
METITGQEIEELFETRIQDNLDSLLQTLSYYDGEDLFNSWRKLIKSIDEFLEIPFEIAKDVEEFNIIQNISSNYHDETNVATLNLTCARIEFKYGIDVLERFNSLVSMCFEMSKYISFEQMLLLPSINLNTMWKCHEYFRSRRLYYITILNLIPKVAKGSLKVSYSLLIGEFWELIETKIVDTTRAYFNLLLNNCITNFEMEFDGNIATHNFNYNHLESIFLEPERLSLTDQIKWRYDTIGKCRYKNPDTKLYSFTNDIENAIINYANVYNAYGIAENIYFKEISYLVKALKNYVVNDFEIIINDNAFYRIQNDLKRLKLHNSSNNFFDTLNSNTPFQKFENNYFSSLLLLQRFIHRTLDKALGNKKQFQINSGFIFEDKVAEILENKGFLITNTKRINHKEFDLITVKNNVVYNFQCKNNFINIFDVLDDYRKVVRRNKYLNKYYERALLKEESREELIKEKTRLSIVKHFVISRFPIINENDRIINFNELETWDSI